MPPIPKTRRPALKMEPEPELILEHLIRSLDTIADGLTSLKALAEELIERDELGTSRIRTVSAKAGEDAPAPPRWPTCESCTHVHYFEDECDSMPWGKCRQAECSCVRPTYPAAPRETREEP
jgi:hypothetical protein